MVDSKPAVVPDLTVKGESIERVYGIYSERRYIVNRRYQRKLIWTLDEKIAFIDSIMRGYPVPIILLAENINREVNAFEIIDGMQRLNAITAFIENEYAVNGKYFDLNTMAVTKAAMDSGSLDQKTPVMDRGVCVTIAGYLLPLSIYEFSSSSNVDDVFRRINSGGRKLSRQELRLAGATGHFAHAVRKIAAKIRGDDSRTDILNLQEMKKISITNRDLLYGIKVEDVFWVHEGILTKDQLRESLDEQLVSDIVAFMVSDKPQSSRSEFLDDFFGMAKTDAGLQRFAEIEAAVQRRNVELVINDFNGTLDEIKLTLDFSGKTFVQLLFGENLPRAPRYFQAVFLAFYRLIIRDGMEVSDRSLLVQKMNDSGRLIAVPEGGRWGAEDRDTVVNQVAGMYNPAFKVSNTTDPAVVHWITQLQNILSQSYTEQAAYDFKQGFLRLDGGNVFDDDAFDKILKTCVGISNLRKGGKGYVLAGVAETAQTARRVKEIFGAEAKPYEGFFILGVDHEAAALGKTADQLFQLIVNKVKDSALSPELKDFIARHIKPVRYYDKTVYVFEVEAQADPSHFGGVYYVRRGAQLDEIKTADLAPFFRRYITGM